MFRFYISKKKCKSKLLWKLSSVEGTDRRAYWKHEWIGRCPVRGFWATVYRTIRRMLSDRCRVSPSCLSICNVGIFWPNGWTDPDETWHAGRPRPWPRCLRRKPSSPSLKGAQPPTHQFSVYISVVAALVDGLIDPSVWRKASAKATLR